MKESKNVDFIFDVMRMKLEQLFDASNVLDQKISVVLGFQATIIAGLIAFLKEDLLVQLCPFYVNYFTGGILFLLSAVLCCILAITTKKYHYPPNEDELYSEKSLNEDIVDLKGQTIADMKQSFKDNHAAHEQKASLFNLSVWLTLIGLILIIAFFL